MQLVGIFEGNIELFSFVILIRKILICSAYDYVLPARGKITAQTDIQIAVPNGCYGRVG
jgi:hypothetical protein